MNPSKMAKLLSKRIAIPPNICEAILRGFEKELYKEIIFKGGYYKFRCLGKLHAKNIKGRRFSNFGRPLMFMDDTFSVKFTPVKSAVYKQNKFRKRMLDEIDDVLPDSSTF